VPPAARLKSPRKPAGGGQEHRVHHALDRRLREGDRLPARVSVLRMLPPVAVVGTMPVSPSAPTLTVKDSVLPVQVVPEYDEHCGRRARSAAGWNSPQATPCARRTP
jgi:hypothetical protein